MRKEGGVFSAIINEQPKTIEEPPSELVEFRGLSNFEKNKSIESGFFYQDFIKNYLEEKWKAELHNSVIFKQLYELYIDPEYEKDRSEIEIRLKQFKDVMISNDEPYLALMINFEKYSFESPIGPVGAEEIDRVNWDG